VVQNKRSGKGRIKLFRGETAVPLKETGMMIHSTGPVGLAGLKRLYDAGIDAVSDIRCLFRSDDPRGPSLAVAWFKGNYTLPPHKHDTDCIYYVLSGSLRLGTRVLKRGDGLFVGADTQYTYTTGAEGVEILEFRPSSRFDINLAEGTPASWERLVKMCEENRELWGQQERPEPIQHES
jgi:hypothetical protein